MDGENTLKDKIFIDFIESQRIDMKCTSADELESSLLLSCNNVNSAKEMNDNVNVKINDKNKHLDEDEDTDSITCSADQDTPRLKRIQYSFEMKSKIVDIYDSHGKDKVMKRFENINDRKISRWKREILEGKKPMGRPVQANFEEEVMKEYVATNQKVKGKICKNKIIQECARKVSERVVDWKEYEHIRKLQFTGRWVQGFKNRAEKREALLRSSDIDSATTIMTTTSSSLSSSD